MSRCDGRKSDDGDDGEGLKGEEEEEEEDMRALVAEFSSELCLRRSCCNLLERWNKSLSAD